MIDNIKMFVSDKQRFEERIEKKGLMELTSKLSMLTGEVTEYPKKGSDSNLQISINLKSATILGSLHKYKNLLEENGDQNYDDFNFCQIQEVIRGLIKKYDIEKDTVLTNLEFGFNLAVSKDPKTIIDSNVLMNNFKSANKNLKFSGSGDYKEFQLTDYRFKIYNKSKQYKLKDNILRVELKIIQKRLLQKLGIRCLEDLLDKEVLKRLFKLFIGKFEGLIIVDDFEPETIPEITCSKLNKYMNPNYWTRINTQKSPKQISKLKLEFASILSKYQLLETKKEIREKLYSKFQVLLDSEDCNPEYRNVA
jgi:hypothetical protein